MGCGCPPRSSGGRVVRSINKSHDEHALTVQPEALSRQVTRWAWLCSVLNLLSLLSDEMAAVNITRQSLRSERSGEWLGIYDIDRFALPALLATDDPRQSGGSLPGPQANKAQIHRVTTPRLNFFGPARGWTHGATVPMNESKTNASAGVHFAQSTHRYLWAGRLPTTPTLEKNCGETHADMLVSILGWRLSRARLGGKPGMPLIQNFKRRPIVAM